eukprot:COSAG01_NODE_16518_length_1230_cov_0.947834_1_plen_55_part_01
MTLIAPTTLCRRLTATVVIAQILDLVSTPPHKAGEEGPHCIHTPPQAATARALLT